MRGEDQEFFTAAHKAGFEIRLTERAVVTEMFHPERETYRAHICRAYWTAASDLRRLAVAKGWRNAITREAHTIPLLLIAGPAELLASPLFLIAGTAVFKRRALAGGKKTAKGLGRAAAMVGRPSPAALSLHCREIAAPAECIASQVLKRKTPAGVRGNAVGPKPRGRPPYAMRCYGKLMAGRAGA